jgi:hypothetical protein
MFLPGSEIRRFPRAGAAPPLQIDAACPSNPGWPGLRVNRRSPTLRPRTVRVVYQGTVTASKYIRAPIPMPDEPFEGMPQRSNPGKLYFPESP